MTKTTKIGQKIAITSVATVVAFTIAIAPIMSSRTNGNAKAETLAELRQKAAVLGEQINQNNNNAQALAAQGETLKATIADLDSQIAKADQQISLINNKLAQLQIELNNAQKELDRQKGLLKASIKQLYKNTGASSVELLVGSDSFSQYFNNQTYLDKLKSGIQESAQKVVSLKQQIQKQQADQKQLLAQEQTIRQNIAATKTEKDNLLAQTQGQEANYRAAVESLRAQQAKVNADLVAKLAASGSGQYYGDGSNGGYPTKWANAPQDTLIDDWGMYNRECVSYAAFKVAQSGRHMPYWGGVGNARQWPGNAIGAGIPVDRNPQVGDVAITMGGYYGHAMYVEAVNGRMVTVSQYNFVAGAYSMMTVSADNSALGAMQFIHFP